MTKLTTKKVKGKEYLYLEESVRIQGKVRNISKYLGSKESLSKKEIKEATENFRLELLDKKTKLRTKHYSTFKLEYPINLDEISKIEEMNVKYKKIVRNLHKKDFQDLNRRFIANYVFESNALEGNSLTLKNVGEIVFENRISKGKDLREVYDAQNSYALFLFLQKTRSRINHNFIIKIHKMLMKGIDDRVGYRNFPMILLGKSTKLAKPSEVHSEMNKLLEWYEENIEKIYPLELALKFHSKFEKIHPFCDGNGRVGRFLINYILMRKGYFPIIIRKTTRNSYINSLEAADRKVWIPLLRFSLKWYKKTFRNFFEVYYKHL
jgi:Fic family protein